MKKLVIKPGHSQVYIESRERQIRKRQAATIARLKQEAFKRERKKAKWLKFIDRTYQRKVDVEGMDRYQTRMSGQKDITNTLVKVGLQIKNKLRLNKQQSDVDKAKQKIKDQNEKALHPNRGLGPKAGENGAPLPGTKRHRKPRYKQSLREKKDTTKIVKIKHGINSISEYKKRLEQNEIKRTEEKQQKIKNNLLKKADRIRLNNVYLDQINGKIEANKARTEHMKFKREEKRRKREEKEREEREKNIQNDITDKHSVAA